MWSNIANSAAASRSEKSFISNLNNESSKFISNNSLEDNNDHVEHDEQRHQQENNNKQDLERSPATTTTTTSVRRKPSGSPLMRYKHAICSSQNGFIYIHGGRYGNLPLEDDVWRFDAHQNTWLQLETRGTSKPPSLQEHTLVEYNEQLYLFGGQVSASNQENSFWRLDLASNEWQSLSMQGSKRFGTYLGPTNRRGHSAVVYRKSMFVFGGYEDFRGSSAQLWQYDLLNGRWELANLSSTSACHPEARHGHSAVVHQDSMYVYGGLSNLKPLGDLWRWSWRDKRWFREKTRGRSPGQLHGHAAIQAFGSMFVFGGERRHGRPSRSLWRLNLSTMSWQKIRPKGPRPSPSTWHAAIANPLHILDEANYIIEGGAEAEAATEDDQQLHASLLLSADSPMLDASSYENFSQQHSPPVTADISIHPSISNTEEDVSLHGRPQTSSDRPVGPPKSNSITLSSTLSKSSRPSAAKKRLRLSFLRKDKAKATSGQQIKLSIPSSLSAANLIHTNHTNAGATNTETPQQTAQRHSIAITNTTDEPQASNNDVEMAAAPPEQSINHKILDNLDTDIKQMFRQVLDPVKIEANQQQQRRDLTRDSMTNSQLSSYLSRSHTYQTANEQLTRSNTITSNNSTLTLTTANGLANSSSQRNSSYRTPPNELSKEDEGRQLQAVGRRPPSLMAGSSAVVRREQNGPRNPRPKSEIVQSLIDRADARIKHLYTPYFNTNNGHHHHHHHHHQHHHLRQNNQQQQQQQQQPKREASFDSNDPLLGKLQSHRMFERSSMSARDRRREASNNNNHHRHSLDKSKRHTIHQTMTYYNLYFSEDNNKNATNNGSQSPSTSINSGNSNKYPGDEESQSAGKQQQQQQRPLVRDDLSSSTIKGASEVSSGAALIGVRDGTHSSHSTTTSGSQMDQLSSLAATLQNSSESRTICASQEPSIDTKQSEGDREDDREKQRQQQQELDHQNGRDTTTSESGDNTSLSFSVIAEFEEDDMLQYSSPTEPIINQRQDDDDDDDSRSRDQDPMQVEFAAGRKEEEEEDQYDDYEQDDDDYLRHSLERHQDMAAKQVGEQQLAAAHKSASSGYDSIHSSYEHQRQTARRPLNGGGHSDGHEDSSYRTESSLGEESSPTGINHNKTCEPKQNNDHHLDRHKTIATTASSTTTDSLALTTSDAFDSSMSNNHTSNYNGVSGQSTSNNQQIIIPSKSLPSSPPETKRNHTQTHSIGHLRENTTASSDVTIARHLQQQQQQHQQLQTKPMLANQCQRMPFVTRSARFFSKKKTKTRYWQLCMFVIGGKQSGVAHSVNEPITMWRLYI